LSDSLTHAPERRCSELAVIQRRFHRCAVAGETGKHSAARRSGRPVHRSAGQGDDGQPVRAAAAHNVPWALNKTAANADQALEELERFDQ
jgi:hypothetical protein